MLLLQGGMSLLAWIAVFVVAASITLVIFLYVQSQRKNRPDKERDGEFRR